MKTNSDIEKFLIQSEIDEILSENPDDWASTVLPNLDYESHLIAIKNLLSVHKMDNNKTTQDIKEIGDFIKETTGAREDYIEHLIDEQMFKFNISVYQSAAHSMAAVGMLAPFLESIFYQSFYGIKDNFFFLKIVIQVITHGGKQLLLIPGTVILYGIKIIEEKI